MSTLLIDIRNPDEYVYYDYLNREWGDQMTAYNNVTITYDSLGNLLSYATAESTHSRAATAK